MPAIDQAAVELGGDVGGAQPQPQAARRALRARARRRRRRAAPAPASGSSQPITSSAWRLRVELGDRPGADDPPAVDDRRGVARLLDLVEQVRGEEHRAALADERADHLAELEDPGRVEAVGRLVEDQQLGVGEQAARDAEALAHALRVARDLLVGAVGEADARERAVDPRERLGAAHRGDDAQVLAPGQVRVEVRLLDDRADARERLARAAAGPAGRAAPSCRRRRASARAACGSSSSCRRRCGRGSRTRSRAGRRA